MPRHRRLRLPAPLAAAPLAALLLPAAVAAGLHGPPSLRVQDEFGTGYEGFAFDEDALGSTFAVGDFDGDGKDDLAIFDRQSITAEWEGAVHVLYSGEAPLSPESDVLLYDFDPETGEIDRELGDAFGRALATGDFNGDGYDDLAIGVPGEDRGFVEAAGAVLVAYGSVEGLSYGGAIPAQRLVRAAAVDPPAPAATDNFGYALAAGDFNGDGMDDLAIGCPGCDAFTNQLPLDSGAVWVRYGSAAGLVEIQFQSHFDQDSADVLNSCETGDAFGWSLATGDFDDDGLDDLAVGVPYEDLGAVADAGAVQVLYGSAAAGALDGEGNQLWRESNVATAGFEEAGDRFGEVLAAGDVTGEGTDDLVIGAPYEDTSGFQDAGAVTLLWGQAGTGLDTPGSEIYEQATLADGESPDNWEHFGAALAIGDFVELNAPGALDLAIGVPWEEVFDPFTLIHFFRAGIVTVVPGGFGLVPAEAEFWALGFRGSAGRTDMDGEVHFGSAVAAGDFNGDGHGDLAVGAVGVEGLTGPGSPGIRAGAAYVLFGSLFACNFEAGTTFGWSTQLP